MSAAQALAHTITLRSGATQIWGSLGPGIFSLFAATRGSAQHSTGFRCILAQALSSEGGLPPA
ncbi:hypothetical protein C8A01DRAFT_15734 [Parachaetomium inaequale]|uniref:Uncharacterized protein n=1 Tax=Parachaetomium inaequale TaxID=2588326 RepID=A0AAN6PJN1_9PEZI|nr:hypothetical protein C8A01DRAFT_15734 [Parachaetomium inaequale]